MAEILRRQPLAELAAAALLDRIRAGEWPLGHKLPGESALAAQLGIGRSTLREAIRELAGQGVLASRQGSGVYVTAIEARDDWDAVLRRADIVSVLEGRIAIETEAAALAASRRTRTDLAALRGALAAREAAGGGIEALVDADTAFHRAVVVAAHNDILVGMFDAFVPRIRTAMIDMLRLAAQPTLPVDHPVHAELVDAIRAGQPQAASAVSRAHLVELTERFA